MSKPTPGRAPGPGSDRGNCPSPSLSDSVVQAHFSPSYKLVGPLQAHLEEQDQWLPSCVSGPLWLPCVLPGVTSAVSHHHLWLILISHGPLFLAQPLFIHFTAVTSVQCDFYTEQLSFLDHLSLNLNWSVFPGSPPWKGDVKDEGILCNVEVCRECGPGHAAVPGDPL